MKYLNSAFDAKKPAFLTSIVGITNAKFGQFTEAHEAVYRQVLRVFHRYDLQYFLFAGSLVGYVRNKQMPLWMDDLDIILFEDQMELFSNTIIPVLKEAGFHCFEPPNFKNGGMHILSLRENERKDAFVKFSKGIGRRVPRAQIDIFFTRVNHEGLLRNLGGWGLYHKKNIPVSWVKPGKSVNIMGTKVPVFSEYEKDIYHEYGDIMNVLRIATHGRVTLNQPNVPWLKVQSEIDELLLYLRNKPFPGCSKAPPDSESLTSSSCVEAKEDDVFISILQSILEKRSSNLVLREPEHLLWVMDLKKQFPELEIHATLDAPEYCSRISQFADLYTSVETNSEVVNDLLCQQISHLEFEHKPTITMGSTI